MDTPQRLLLYPATILRTITLSASTVAEDATVGTVVGAIVGRTPGSTLSLTDSASGKFALNGTNIEVAGALDYETATSHNITVRETFLGAIQKDTIFAITVTDVAEGDALDTKLAALETAASLVSSWFLPIADPDQYLTLNGANVEGWAAAYGTQKVDLAELTNPPQWDATLYSNKGATIYNGTSQSLTGTGNVTNWPGATDDLYMLVAARNDWDGATTTLKSAFAYGHTAGTADRTIGRNASGGVNHARLLAAGGFATGASDSAGSHTIGGKFDIGGNSTVYLDGVSDGTGVTAVAALTLNRVRIGATSSATAGGFWQGAIVAAAILNSTASDQDFLDLEALMRARLS